MRILIAIFIIILGFGVIYKKINFQNINFLIANIPTYFSSHYTLYKDIAYGQKEWQKLDIYVPKNAHNSPVITFFYGGGWYKGHKEDYKFLGDTLTKHGFIVVIPDYGKYPQQKFPAFQHDAVLASSWILKSIENYHGNHSNLHLMGHSAGGHIAIMLLADKSYLKKYGLTPNIYQSFIGLSAPYHFTPTKKKYQAVFRNLKDYKTMQASHFIDGTEPPMLLIQGNQDDIVGNINIERLKQALDKNNNSYQIYRDDLGHTETISAFVNIIGVKNNKIIKHVTDFIRHNSDFQ